MASTAEVDSPERIQIIEEIFKSRQITFLVGPDKVKFAVHEHAFTRLSEPLRIMLTGGMRESLEANVVWDDIEPTIFTRLMQFAYYEDYSVPHLLVKDALPPAPRPKAKWRGGKDFDESEHNEYLASRTINSWMMDYEAGDRGSDCEGDRPGKWSYCRSHFATQMPLSPKHHWFNDLRGWNLTGYSTAFMLHVKLYVLADRYNFDTLTELCLGRVRASLFAVDLEEEFRETLIEMLKFTYSNTVPADTLRMMLIRYCIVQMNQLKRHGVLDRLVSELPDIALELLLEIPRQIWEDALYSPLRWQRS
ncbi:hypothetical protein CTA2_1297 [Colletotrichum tanaceti]|uniref:BTB domain-containing protein n=1 Tax=Colletotrichum tanaceti TaxID=1306861 RepID=A0A4U6XJT6_9PEZI|nr:hypothetical protein CTA2_1297 [Colletotrichum tanaceti]TKW56131.1 hypothetical protein CTA1_3006 [Colletotrichum tanaceti]